MVKPNIVSADCWMMALPKSIGLMHDKTNNGWKMAKNTSVKGAPVIKLVVPIQENEPPTSGDVVLRHFKEIKQLAGQGHAESMLRHESSIPESWEEYFLLFLGTQWLNYAKNRMVPCLHYNGSNWELTFTCLDRKLDKTDRLVIVCTPEA